VKSTSIRRAIVPGIAVIGLMLSACGSDEDGGGSGTDNSGVTGDVIVDGSSTVFPMAQAAEELFREEAPKAKVTVSEAGTGGGFERFCAGETDISNASRPIKEDEEAPICADAGIEYTELQVATDALTVVVHPDLEVDCLTTEQLIELWAPGSTINNWNQLDPSFPDQEISLFGPGTDSGTYDYMAADVIGDESETTRDDYEASEDDNVLVQGVSGTEGATAYFGYSYYEQNADSLKALAIDNGEGCIEPSAETAQDGSYAPLARPLFIYVNNAKYTDNEATTAFVDFFIENLSAIAEAALFIPLSDELYAETESALAGISG
jgi:phosphate transport system substrate-binding protein